MAVSGNKLATWANKGAALKSAPAAPAEEEPMESPDEEMEEEEAPEAEEAAEEMAAGGLKEYAPLMELMEQQAPAIEEAIESSGINMDALLAEEPLEQEDLQKIGEIIVDDEVTGAELAGLMLAMFDDIPYEEAMDLAQHIVDEGYGTDADVLGGFIFHAKETFPAIHEAIEAHEQGGDAAGGDNPVARLAAATGPAEGEEEESA
jgi:hypothetical protein